MMHFPPVSDFPPTFEKFSDSVENFTFSRKISRFSSAKISDDLFLQSSTTHFEFPPIFPVSVYFPPTLKNFPPLLEKFTCFLHTLCVFREEDALLKETNGGGSAWLTRTPPLGGINSSLKEREICVFRFPLL